MSKSRPSSPERTQTEPQAPPAAAATAASAREISKPWGIFEDFAGGKHGQFFKVVPDFVDPKLPPGYSPITAPTIWDWVIGAVTLRHVWASPNTVWSLIALAMYFAAPFDLAAGSPAARSPVNADFFMQRLPLWVFTYFLYAGFWHVTLYGLGWAERPFIQPKDKPLPEGYEKAGTAHAEGREYNSIKVLHNMGYSLSGLVIWVFFENIFCFLWASGRLPYLTDKAAFATPWGALNFFLGLAFIPVWRDAHFYFAHRLLHYKPLYDQVHSLHHRNQDIEPFAGLSMHPVEHLYYYSCVLPSLVFFCSPFHFLWNGVHLILAPGASHSGYEDHFQADAFHYLHHKYFECNYAGLGAAALDVYFNTFKARMNEADKGAPGAFKAVKAPPPEKSSKCGLPDAQYVIYMLLAGACVGAWASGACSPSALVGPLKKLTAAGLTAAQARTALQWGLSLLAGFGPVWAAQLVNAMFGKPSSLLADNSGAEGVEAGSSKSKGILGLSAPAFHVLVGSLFCSIPVTWMCLLAF